MMDIAMADQNKESLSFMLHRKKAKHPQIIMVTIEIIQKALGFRNTGSFTTRFLYDVFSRSISVIANI